jgi:hypothetical protein
MTTIEDAVSRALAAHAAAAPVRLDGRSLLERVARRRAVARRVRIGAVAAAVAVLVTSAGVWRARPASVTVAGAPSASASPRVPGPTPPPFRTAVWGELAFDVPRDWTWNDTREVHPLPAGALSSGPFLGTLPTGPMCWTDSSGAGGCSRAHGVLQRRPTDGVVAWIDAGRIFPGMPDRDPGSSADDVCPPHGTTFHDFHRLRVGNQTYRIVLDGCAYGPRAKTYLAELSEVANSVRPA